MTFKEYIKIVSINTGDAQTDWDQRISVMKSIPVGDLLLMKKREYDLLFDECNNELLNILWNNDADGNPIMIKSFEFNNKNYIVDSSIYDGNVILLRDHAAIGKKYNTPEGQYDLLKHTCALTFFEEGSGNDVYNSQRYYNNLFMIDRLPVEIVFGIANFFLYLLALLKQISLEYTQAIPTLKTLESILTDPEIASMIDSTDSTN